MPTPELDRIPELLSNPQLGHTASAGVPQLGQLNDHPPTSGVHLAQAFNMPSAIAQNEAPSLASSMLTAHGPSSLNGMTVPHPVESRPQPMPARLSATTQIDNRFLGGM